jgi:integral membrane sensor domain MASE1|tara:strand:- start:113 stop:715 length:603 start_codon:yes stop_codon:yes gene_type:complete
MALSREIVRVANRVGAHPFDLANLINHESAGTFSPSVKNPNSSATGLIQFMAATARGMGTSTAKLARMGKVEQMKWVEKYLARKTRIAPLNTVHALFMAVFYPKAMRWSLDHDFPARVQRANPGTFKVRDYVAHALKNAKLPSSVDVGAAPLTTLPFGIAKRLAKTTPTWMLILFPVVGALVLGLLLVGRRRPRRPTPPE